MPKKCRTPKNGECGENQGLRSWYVLRNKEEEIPAFRYLSPESPMAAGEIRERVAETDGNGRAAAAQCFKRGQGWVDAIAVCGRRAGAGFRDLSGLLLSRLISEALSGRGSDAEVKGESSTRLSGARARPPGQILQTCKRSQVRTQTWFALVAVPVCP